MAVQGFEKITKKSFVEQVTDSNKLLCLYHRNVRIFITNEEIPGYDINKFTDDGIEYNTSYDNTYIDNAKKHYCVTRYASNSAVCLTEFHKMRFSSGYYYRDAMLPSQKLSLTGYDVYQWCNEFLVVEKDKFGNHRYADLYVLHPYD